MKKFLATFTVVAILCGSIIGCGDADKDKKTTAKDKDKAGTTDKKDKDKATTP